MTSYADPSNLAQITPGELSKDQAVPSFYYIDTDKEKFLLRRSYLLLPTGEGFWDSVGSSLAVGSYITCRGYAGTTGDRGISIATVRVESITKAESSYKYPYRVVTRVGPNSLLTNYDPSIPPTGQPFRSNISGSNLLYRGVIVMHASGTPGLTGGTVQLNGFGINSRCVALGTLVNRSAALGGPYPLTGIYISWVEPLLNALTYYYLPGFAPTSAQRLSIYTEVYHPTTPIN